MSYDEFEHGDVWALDFERYPGLTVRMRRPGFAAARLLARAGAVLDDKSASTKRRMAAWAEVFAALADSMESWTLTRHGRPVPTTRDAVLATNAELLGHIAAAWRVNVVNGTRSTESVDRPPEADSAGEQRVRDQARRDLELGLPMEALAGPAEEGRAWPVTELPEAELPEDRGVPLSLDPVIAAAQRVAWQNSDEPARAAVDESSAASIDSSAVADLVSASA